MALVPFSAALVAIDGASSAAARNHVWAQKARTCRLLHFANVPPWLTSEDQLKAAVLAKMTHLRKTLIESSTRKSVTGIVAIDDVISVSINRSRDNTNHAFAFVEVSMDDMATALAAEKTPQIYHVPTRHGTQIETCELRVRRQGQYQPMHGVNGTSVLIVGLVEPASQRAQFAEVLAHFGKFRSDAYPAVISSNPCGMYVEYEDAAAADEAVRELNGVEIGGRVVVAQLASDNMRMYLHSRHLPVSGIDDNSATDGFFAPDPLRDITVDLCNMQLSLTQVLANFASTCAPHLAPVWPVVLPTRILILMNMFDAEELLDDGDDGDEHDGGDRRRGRSAGGDGAMTEAARQLRAEVEEEMEQYGRIKNFFMLTEAPRPPTEQDALAALREEREERGIERERIDETISPRDIETQLERMMFRWYEMRNHPVFGEVAIGKIFVEYMTVDEAERAQKGVAGRLFNGRTIVTSFLFEDVLYPPEDDEDMSAMGFSAAGAKPEPQAQQQQQQQQQQQDAAASNNNKKAEVDDLD